MIVLALVAFFFFPDIVGFAWCVAQRLKGDPWPKSLRDSKRPEI